MLVVQPSGGSASQPILGPGRVACGAADRGGTRTGLSGDIWREFPALAVAVLSSLARDSDVSGEDLYYRAKTDYSRVFRRQPDKPRSRKPEDRPVFRGPLVGQNATRRRTALPLHLREGDEACTTLLSCARSARGILPLLPSVIPALRSPEPGRARAALSPARASREPPIG
jgi:hypothetical protein